MTVLKKKELEESPLADLHAIASELGLEGFRSKRKNDLIAAILEVSGSPSTTTDEEREPDEVPAEEALETPTVEREEEPEEEDEESSEETSEDTSEDTSEGTSEGTSEDEAEEPDEAAPEREERGIQGGRASERPQRCCLRMGRPRGSSEHVLPERAAPGADRGTERPVRPTPAV